MIPATDSARPVNDPSMTILRGAGFPAIGVVLLTAAVFAVAGGVPEGASALLGGGITVLALAVVPLVQRLTRRLDPTLVLGLAVLAYSVVMIAVGLAYAQVNDLSWLHSTPAGIGAVVAIVGWTAGHIWTSQHLRQHVYDGG